MNIQNNTTNGQTVTIAGQTAILGPTQNVVLGATNGTLVQWAGMSANVNDGSLVTLNDGPTMSVVVMDTGAPLKAAAFQGLTHGAAIMGAIMIFILVRRAWTIGDRTYID